MFLEETGEDGFSPGFSFSIPGPSTQLNPTTTSLTTARPDPYKVPEICFSNLLKQCKLEGQCPDMHYHLPHRWQINKGTDWEDIPNMEEIEKCYCDPSTDSVQSIDFVTMRSGVHPVRRLSTVSSVKKPPGYDLTTEWLWYWKHKNGAWTPYGQSNVITASTAMSSSDLENVYLAFPTSVVPFIVGRHCYEINFSEMKQRNIWYETEREVRRRPKYQSLMDLLMRSMKLSATVLPPKSAPRVTNFPQEIQSETYFNSASLITMPGPPSLESARPTFIYPRTWDTSALPDINCQKVPVSRMSREFSEIVSSFTNTVSGHVVKKLWRLQNPSLWQVFTWQKEQMKNRNQGQDVKEMRLFHGTDTAHIDAICNQNFDWRLCGTHGTAYGQGSYFARDALYSHKYSSKAPDGTRLMFMARVLVGDFTIGNQQMKRPPQRPGSTTEYYDSCVNNVTDPSIFVVFEKHQIYPEYLLEYEEEEYEEEEYEEEEYEEEEYEEKEYEEEEYGRIRRRRI
ncbi:protein mono-ADP-ribosyltransferase PARP12-like [Hyla sarda]|uniref:protein mono-ADP-ribosyltransferase PARP12-like n=1 Tax=Hyla sarda TaxID=327740 RepID=UPI0024C38039|nr:protein mono-ADP-ribosyltransferase PARP12-like [Hyla sarda]